MLQQIKDRLDSFLENANPVNSIDENGDFIPKSRISFSIEEAKKVLELIESRSEFEKVYFKRQEAEELLRCGQNAFSKRIKKHNIKPTKRGYYKVSDINKLIKLYK